MKLLNYFKENKLSKILLWFFIYTIITFIVGIICKVLVAWHVEDVRHQIEQTNNLFVGAAKQPDDISAAAHFFRNINSVSGGDGGNREDIFAVFKNHISGHEAQIMQMASSPSTVDLSFLKGFKADLNIDLDYLSDLKTETAMIFWLQIVLIVLTIAAYPYGIYKLWKLKHNSELKYTKKLHIRFIIEYVIFVALFIIIDAYAIYLLIKENVPMTFWNLFSIISVAIPTTFAFGSLTFIWFQRKHVVK